MANREIANKAAQMALANVGVREEGINDGKFIRMYQNSCVPKVDAHGPWCAAFIQYRLRKAALDLEQDIPDDFPTSGWCPSYSAWAKKNDLWVPAKSCIVDSHQVRVGDLALFYFKPLGRVAHIGIVVEKPDNAGGVWTVEGNTSPEPEDYAAVERDGDGVVKKWRTWGEFGQYGGFVRIQF
jgi:hypothetical protein